MANCQGKLSHFSVMLCAKLLHSCSTLCSPIDCSPPGSSIHGILQAEYGSGLPCPPPGDLPDPGIKPTAPISPKLSGRFLTTEPLEKPKRKTIMRKKSKTCINKTAQCYSTYLCGNNDTLKFSASRNFRHGNFNSL